MTSQPRVRRFAVFVGTAALAIAGVTRADGLRLGVDGQGAGQVPINGVQTIIDISGAAPASGFVTSARFLWWGHRCPAAVKVKFFRPRAAAVPFLGASFDFVAERGPFDVPEPFIGITLPDFAVTRTVSLFPPVAVQTGDLVGLTVLTNCGSPAFAGPFPPLLPPGGLWFSGDVRSTVVASQAVLSTAPVVVVASDTSATLTLLNDRFSVFVSARDPRTNLVTTGSAVKLGEGSGYFSLPDFTGDPSIPEITIKMVDATGTPALGGDFWFFYAPLTDSHFLITVVDEKTYNARTYSSQAGGSGVFCGEADTSAFVP